MSLASTMPQPAHPATDIKRLCQRCPSPIPVHCYIVVRTTETASHSIQQEREAVCPACMAGQKPVAAPAATQPTAVVADSLNGLGA
jgi:hypothetical protein